MGHELTVHCGGASSPGKKKGSPLRLDAREGKEKNVFLNIASIGKWLSKRLPPVFADLLEIAAYVYVADQCVSRGGDVAKEVGADWRRTFHFTIPVRKPEFWARTEMHSALADLLAFLSDDAFNFKFAKHHAPMADQGYLTLGGDAELSEQVQDIALFSGGLDSLAGAVDASVNQGRRIALVSHFSNELLKGRQLGLLEGLTKACPQNGPVYVPVHLHMIGIEPKDTSQRCRSFVFASMAAAVASMLRKGEISVFENGPISLNLPICGQSLGTRSTRSTHPKSLALMEKLFGLISGKEFKVKNPFLFSTRAELIDIVGDVGLQELIGKSKSCSKTRGLAAKKSHCGRCSQCIDRRFGALASKYGEHDPVEGYETEIFLDPLEEETDRALASSVVRYAREVREMSVEDFCASGEMSRVLRYLPHPKVDSATALWETHRRHSKQILDGLGRKIEEHSDLIAAGKVPAASLLRMTVESRPGARPLEAAARESGQPSMKAAANKPKASRSRKMPHLIPKAIEYIENNGGSAGEAAYQGFLASIHPGPGHPWTEGIDYPTYLQFRKWWSDKTR